MGSFRYRGIRFVAFADDHLPRHVHAFTEEVEVIVDLRSDGTVGIAKRKGSVQPANAKRTAVVKILQAAAANFETLVVLWETMKP